MLFIGNSYTQFNNLPGLFTELSASGNRAVIAGYSAFGGAWLEDHLAYETTLNRIGLGDWDYVVLQEQSQVPTIDYWRYNSMYPAARSLDSLILESGNEHTCFFMTWGRKYGGQQSIGGYNSPEFADFYQMQDSLDAAYTQIAEELDAVLAPVGNAWATAFSQDSLIDLWQADLSHPTLQGSYLTACVFYAELFGDSPVGLTFYAGLDPETAEFLQLAADQTVLKVKPIPPSSDTPDFDCETYPEPFNATTTITYYLRQAEYLTLTVYDISGRMVATLADGWQAPGQHLTRWDGRTSEGWPVSSGIYFYRLVSDNLSTSGTLLLVK